MWFDAQQSVYFAEAAVPQEDEANEARGRSREEEAPLLQAGSRGWRGKLESQNTRCTVCVPWISSDSPSTNS